MYVGRWYRRYLALFACFASLYSIAAMSSLDGANLFADESLADSDVMDVVTRIVTTMYDAVVVHDAGVIIFVNQAAATLLGVETPQQMLGRHVLDFVHANDHAKAKMRIRHLLIHETGYVGTDLYTLLRDDGEEIYAELQASRISRSKPLIMIVAHDVTEKHRYYQQLSRLQQVVDQAVDAIYAIDTDGRFIFANRSCEELLKTSHAELMGQLYVPFIAPYHLERVRESLRRKLNREESSSTYELDVVDTDGGIHVMENSATLITDDYDNPVALQGVLRDLSSRKRHEKEIRMLTQVMEHVGESIVITDMSGVICYANRQACELFALSRQQIVGRAADDLYSGVEGDDSLRGVVGGMRAGQQWQKLLDLTLLDGSRHLLARVISPIPDSDGQIHCVACIDRDITEQKEQQRRLEHAQRLESLGVLAGGIAHDFNNILTAIVGNVALVESRLRCQPLEAQRCLERIKQSTDRAALLCRQMLAYSGKGQFVIRDVDISQEVRDMSSLLPVSLKKQVSLAYELSDERLMARVDQAQLQQLIMNLITNANEAIDGVGHIVLRTGMMLPDEEWLKGCVGVAGGVSDSSYLFIQVEDDGCGMDKATCAKIFDPFFTTKFTGRGLGMSALLGIVRGHNGYIHIDSTPGRGSIFTVLLPSVATDGGVADRIDGAGGSAGVAEPVVEYGGGIGVTVLVVDDESSVRASTSAMLESAGYRVLQAGDGVEGVACYRQHAEEIGLVLLDLLMPCMGGREALALLRRLNPTLPVLLTSGYDGSDAEQLITEGRLCGFLPKPYTAEQLCAAVGSALAKRETADA
ncbi:MAG: PAS domain S-box protein [Mariprofundales bacterium]|nr:PAS domain S-box protein [Mariprofundales bacterium]